MRKKTLRKYKKRSKQKNTSKKEKISKRQKELRQKKLRQRKIRSKSNKVRKFNKERAGARAAYDQLADPEPEPEPEPELELEPEISVHNDSCNICLVDFKEGDLVIALKAFGSTHDMERDDEERSVEIDTESEPIWHVYHPRCLKEWKQTTSGNILICPLTRKKYTDSDAEENIKLLEYRGEQKATDKTSTDKTSTDKTSTRDLEDLTHLPQGPGWWTLFFNRANCIGDSCCDILCASALVGAGCGLGCNWLLPNSPLCGGCMGCGGGCATMFTGAGVGRSGIEDLDRPEGCWTALGGPGGMDVLSCTGATRQAIGKCCCPIDQGVVEAAAATARDRRRHPHYRTRSAATRIDEMLDINDSVPVPGIDDSTEEEPEPEPEP